MVIYIQLESNSKYILYVTPEKFAIKGIIKYKIIICKRGEIPMHFHQPLNFQPLKDEVIKLCNKKPVTIILRKKQKELKTFSIKVLLVLKLYTYILLIKSIFLI